MISSIKLKAIFLEEFGEINQPIHCFFAPGRVNLIGEYTDINGGYVFPAALSLGIYGAIRSRSDSLIQLKSTNTSSQVTVDLNQPIVYKEDDGWGNYPKGIIKYLQDDGYPLKGWDILYSGNLPDGAGLSSSAAILVLTAFMICSVLGEKEIDRSYLARFCQKVENNFIQVNCGIMDQFSIANGKKDQAILLDCQTLSYQYIPFILKEHSLVIMNTSKKRELTESKYNERRSECDKALEIIRKHRWIDNLCQATLDEVEKFLDDDIIRRRARHAVSENIRVLMAIKLLKEGNILGFGRLLMESHRSLQEDFEVSGPELDCIVESALQFPGCIGARMTGAGFGGCAIALVVSNQLSQFTDYVKKRYREITGLTPEFYVAGIADGVNNYEY